MNKLVSGVAGLLFSTGAIAGQGWTGPREILGLEVFPGGVELRLAGFGGACTGIIEFGVQKTWAKIDLNQANEKQFVATLLTAFSTGKAINVHCPSATDWTALDRIAVVNP